MDTIVTPVVPASIQQLARLDEVLRRAGIGANEIQLLIDDVSRRNLVVQTWLYGDAAPEIDLPEEFDEEAMKRFIAHVFKYQIDGLQRLDNQLGYELVSNGYEPMQLATTERVKSLLKGLSAAHTKVAVLRSGLVDGKEVTAARVAQELGVSVIRVSNMRADVTQHVRARQQGMYPFRQYKKIDQPTLIGPIESLGLSIRVYNALQRAEILTIEELASKSSDDLSCVRNLGMSGIDEIRKALTRRKREFGPA